MAKPSSRSVSLNRGTEQITRGCREIGGLEESESLRVVVMGMAEKNCDCCCAPLPFGIQIIFSQLIPQAHDAGSRVQNDSVISGLHFNARCVSAERTVPATRRRMAAADSPESYF